MCLVYHTYFLIVIWVDILGQLIWLNSAQLCSAWLNFGSTWQKNIELDMKPRSITKVKQIF